MTRRVAHSEVINPAIACIYDQMRQRIVGTGFTVTERHVVTCAHVVNAALERHEAELTPPSEQAQITLSFLNSPEPELQRELTAKVVRWLPKASGFYDNDDIAILELLDLPKPLALPKLVRLDTRDYFSQRPFQAFGFNVSEGSWTHGQIGGLTAQDTIQLNMERPIEQGFSGAPVWDKAERGVIGMLITIRSELKTAYMIPLTRLLEVFPEADKVTIPRNPYRGLAMFEEQHAQDFFGREQVTQALTQRVENSPFVLLMGISGSGKSSVLNAGLTYQLHQQGNWLVIKVRPFNQPFHDLARGLLNVLYTDPIERATQEKTLIDQLEQQSISLASLCHSALQANGKERLLLIVDQFEELYTHSIEPKTQASYIDLLLSLLTDASGKLGLLLSLRADFMARLLAYTPLAQTLQTYTAQQFILTGMSKDELRSAIVEPAEQLGVSLEQGLVERILHELAEDSAGQLPLLEFALTELWQRQQGRCLTHQALDEIGGVAHALAQHAEQVFKSYSAPDQEAIKRIMVKLIAPGAGSEDTRQVARFSDFSPADQTLLPKLASERLIVTGKKWDEEQQTLEVIHEALIREWGALQAWMDEYREFRVWEERLKLRLADWGKHAKASDDLLTGRYLLEAQEYFASHAAMLGDDAKNFIRLSAKAERRQRFTRWGMVAGVVATISVVAGLAIWQWRDAVNAKVIAQAEQQKTTTAFDNARELIRVVASSLPSKDKPVNYDKLDQAFKQLITSDFVDADTITSIYSLLGNDKVQKEKLNSRISQLLQRALEADPENSLNLGNYAYFMDTTEHNYEEADTLYQRALKADPINTNALINYALFMEKVRHNYEEADTLYQRALKADPTNANILGDYALFMVTVRHNYEEADTLYQRALKADPTNANILGDYALFMVTVRHNYEEADTLYQRALKADPTNANILGNYALFMVTVRHNYEEADTLYQRALKADPTQVSIINNYAYFMQAIRHNYEEADTLYQRALKLNPTQAIIIGNFAQLKLINGDYIEGKKLINHSFAENNGVNHLLDLKLWLCRLAHFPTDYPEAKEKILTLLINPENWEELDFSRNIARAKQENNPHVKFLEAVAEVINKRAEFDSLRPYMAE